MFTGTDVEKIILRVAQIIINELKLELAKCLIRCTHDADNEQESENEYGTWLYGQFHNETF